MKRTSDQLMVGRSCDVRMDLTSATWMVRSLGEPVSCVHTTSDRTVFAGGWNGRVACWDGEGSSLWTVQTEDRISAFAINDDLVVVTSGLHLVALDRATGEERWRHALEGSADTVVWQDDSLLAVSSVYDIEHNDFIESAVWCCTTEGELRWVERLDERPWSVLVTAEGVFAGLGRPRCGHLVLSSPPFTHVLPPTDSPTTCGSAAHGRAYFGQTDGTVRSLDGTVLSTESASVEHLTCMVKGYVATTDTGHAVGRTDEGIECWSAKGESVTCQMEAFIDGDVAMVWLARKDGQRGLLEVWRSDRSGRLAHASLGRVHSMHHRTDRAVVGCEDGEVLVWDQSLLNRRLEHAPSTNDEPEDERASALQAKLRALRQA